VNHQSGAAVLGRERDRRREPRNAAGGLIARIRAGHRLVVIDLSARGALVEGRGPLRPGSRVEVHLEWDTRRAMVAARVLRCTVAAIDAESGVTYRAALAFSELCEWIREAVTPRGHDLPHAVGAGLSPGGAAGELIPALDRDHLSLAGRPTK
jgi:PilZ domain-containing protein